MTKSNSPEKFLNLIAEQECVGGNYFDAEKEFFLIESDNLAAVETRLYGYSIQRSGIYDNDNLTPKAADSLDGRGCYVYVAATDGKITIEQDLNGSWGIYLFRKGDYFALSNSFFRLLDCVKFRFPLTVNRDYCHYLLINGLCSHSYSETAVNEISLIDRSAILQIDMATKTLRIGIIDYREHTRTLDSAEGMTTLDRWLEFWSGLLGDLSQHTNFIAADLSGGFDSRMAFILLLHSGFDLGKVQIRSNRNTNLQDYEVASQIAAHYGFELNHPLPVKNFLNYSLADIFNIDLYCKQTVHKMFSSSGSKFIGGGNTLQRPVDKIYHIVGFGGETIRSYWYKPTAAFFEQELRQVKNYSPAVAREIADSIKNILRAAVVAVCQKHGINNVHSPFVAQYLYEETRCRHHFGKLSLINHFKNVVLLSPLLDPELRTLRLNADKCEDLTLLAAVIFTRYSPELLNIPFEGGRSINPQTVDYARRINERFPRRMTTAVPNLVGGGGISFTAA